MSLVVYLFLVHPFWPSRILCMQFKYSGKGLKHILPKSCIAPQRIKRDRYSTRLITSTKVPTLLRAGSNFSFVVCTNERKNGIFFISTLQPLIDLTHSMSLNLIILVALADKDFVRLARYDLIWPTPFPVTFSL